MMFVMEVNFDRFTGGKNGGRETVLNRSAQWKVKQKSGT